MGSGVTNRMRILAADDDRITRKLLAVNLERWGYEPVLAADGLEAWEILQSEDAPEIVVLDWLMPGMDGIEVCRALRKQSDRAYRYVLLLAPKMQKGDVITAFEAGADDFIAKPINLQDFEDRLTTAVRGLSARKKYGIAATRPGEGFEPANEHTKVEPESPSQATLAGKVVGGKYKVLRPIASGGMGTVWEGSHTTLGTRVAIKFIRPEYTKDTDSMARFETEARVMARLQSRYAVHVYDYGVTPGGLPYLVMEYLEGRSLTDVIEKDGALTPQGVATVVSQAAHALDRAHRLGVIHRDVKPDNIMLIPDEDSDNQDAPWHVKLVDFGVAKVLLEASAPVEVEGTSPSALRRPTARGVLLGTPAFMSPEQLLASGVTDKHTDLWGLAVCAFVAMTGRLPYNATSLGDLVKQVCLNPPPVPSQINPAAPPAFDAWFARACASNIDDRFQSGVEFARELQTACGVARPSLLGGNLTPLPFDATPARGLPAATESWGPGAPTPVRGLDGRPRNAHGGFIPSPPRAPGNAALAVDPQARTTPTSMLHTPEPTGPMSLRPSGAQAVYPSDPGRAGSMPAGFVSGSAPRVRVSDVQAASRAMNESVAAARAMPAVHHDDDTVPNAHFAANDGGPVKPSNDVTPMRPSHNLGVFRAPTAPQPTHRPASVVPPRNERSSIVLSRSKPRETVMPLILMVALCVLAFELGLHFRA